MDTSTGTIRDLLSVNSQYLVPKFQRSYGWDREQWEPFWEDLIERYGTENRGRHFIGSFVLSPAPNPNPMGPGQYVIVDGQQRLITIVAILCAVRDALADADERAVIDNQLLGRPNEWQAAYRIRASSVGKDDDTLNALIRGSEADQRHQITRAYRFFVDALKKGYAEADMLLTELSEAEEGDNTVVARTGSTEEEPRTGFDVKRLLSVLLDGLEHVLIVISNNEDAYRIFETLNARGLELTQVDLLRNGVFILIPEEEHDVFERVWLPMERTFGPKQLENFFLSEFIRQGNKLSRKRIYQVAMRGLRSKSNRNTEDVVRELEVLQDHSELYAAMIRPYGTAEFDATGVLHGGVKDAVFDLEDWGSLPAHPVMLDVLLQRRDERLTSHEGTLCLRMIESYLVRRMLARYSQSPLRSTFMQMMGDLRARSEELTPQWVHDYLRQPERNWPRDEEVVESLEGLPFYRHGRGGQRFYVLKKLASHLQGREAPAIEHRTGRGGWQIEHIMPQSLSESWISDLKTWGVENRSMVPEALSDTIGNLTLTPFNQELGNRSFEQKQRILREHSSLELHGDVVAAWSGAEKRLSDVVSVFRRFAARSGSHQRILQL